MSSLLNQVADIYPTVLQTTSDSCVYFGDLSKTRFVVASRHRESDAISRSNFQCIQEDLKHHGKVERLTHDLVGWIEYLIVDYDAPNWVLEKIVEVGKELKAYPIYNEDHYSELIEEEFWEYAESELGHITGWDDKVYEIIHQQGGIDYEVNDVIEKILERESS